VTVAYQLRTPRTAKYAHLESLVDYADDPTDVHTFLLGSFPRSSIIEPIKPSFSQPYDVDIAFTAPDTYPESGISGIGQYLLTTRGREYLEFQSYTPLQQWETILSRLTTTFDFPGTASVNELRGQTFESFLSTGSNATNVAIGLVIVAAFTAHALSSDPRADILSGFDGYKTADWDGYGAEPISQETIDAAREFLTLIPNTLGDPEIAPGADGTVDLEWVLRDGALRKLFIDIGPGRLWTAYWRRELGEKRTLPRQRIDEHTPEHLAKLFSDLST
jgi:hypothetical protein